MIKAGIYIDYKGDHYDVMGTAVHSQTAEIVVVYHAMDDRREWIVCPLDLFSFRLVTSNESG